MTFVPLFSPTASFLTFRPFFRVDSTAVANAGWYSLTLDRFRCSQLWKWLLAMYYIVNSSKGISSVYLGKWVGISQKSAWKIGHAIRKMMDPGSELVPSLQGIVELDEKYIGGKPRYEDGVKHKRSRGTEKQ